MSNPRHVLSDLRMFLTTDYPCGYLPDRSARNLVADPTVTDNALYSQLAELGFRRSGNHIYRPHCQGCMACRSLRIPVEQFRPNRSQRRIWNRNQDLHARILKAEFREEHFELFARYVSTRHVGGGMDPATKESYWSFITSHWSTSWLCEFRLGQTLLAVAVIDLIENGLSAVYTYFEPNEAGRGLGTYAILWQIAKVKSMKMPWVYLGYWIPESDKMAYKSSFKPHEIFIPERWHWMIVDK